MLWMGIAMMTLYLAGNGYVFWRLWQVMSSMPMGVRVAFAVVYWVVALSFFVAMGMRNSEHCTALVKAMMWLGTAWMVFTLYMVMATALFDIIHLFVPALRFGVLYALGITTCLLVYGYVNYRSPRVEHLDIELDKGLSGGGVRVVMASDIHLGYGTDRSDLERYVEMINAQHPDVVVIVGDLIDNSLAPVVRENMGEVLARIEAPQGLFVVPGNHEYISGIIRGNPTPITRRHINENYNNVSKAKIGCIYFSAQRGFLDVFEEAGSLLFTGQEITVFKGYFLLAFHGGRNFNI